MLLLLQCGSNVTSPAHGEATESFPQQSVVLLLNKRIFGVWIPCLIFLQSKRLTTLKNRTPLPSLVPAATPLLTSSQLWSLYLNRLWFQLEPVPHCTGRLRRRRTPSSLTTVLHLRSCKTAGQRLTGFYSILRLGLWGIGSLWASQHWEEGEDREWEKSFCEPVHRVLYLVWTSEDEVDDINSLNHSLHAVKLRQFVLFEFMSAECLTILSKDGLTEFLFQLFFWAGGF